MRFHIVFRCQDRVVRKNGRIKCTEIDDILSIAHRFTLQQTPHYNVFLLLQNLTCPKYWTICINYACTRINKSLVNHGVDTLGEKGCLDVKKLKVGWSATYFATYRVQNGRLLFLSRSVYAKSG